MTTLNTMRTLPSTPTTGTETRLHGRWLWVARLVWAALITLTVVMLAASAPLHLEVLRTSCAAEPCAIPIQISTENARLLQEQIGMTLDFYGWYWTILTYSFPLVFLAVAAVIVWRKSNDWMALFVSLMLVTFAATSSPAIDVLANIQPILQAPLVLLRVIGIGSFVVVFYLFPDGRFVPRWTRWLAIVWLAALLIVIVQGQIFENPWVIIIGFATGAGAQVYRYFRVSTPLQRQQTKWIVLAISCLAILVAVGFILAFVLQSLGYGPASLQSVLYSMVQGPLFLILPLTLIPVAFAFSILRYRLWDVDFVINRGLVYGGLTVLLAALFGGSLFAISQLFRGFAGGPLVALTISAAIFGAVFQPVRRWLRAFVDRRLYGIQVPYATPPGHTTSTAGLTRTQLGQYTGLQPMGGGGMADVYRAQHPTLNRPVAVKMLPARLAANEELRRRFVREAQTVAVLKHPHIVQMFDFGEIEGIPYMVMEFIDGPTLSDYLRECGQLSLEETGAILSEVSSALDYAHGQGLVHRDIKPSNVMLEPATSSGGDHAHRAVLMDFGIAKVAQAATRLTHTGVMGTFDYMSPEQIQEAADVDGRADVYALGIMTYQMLTGELPFKHASAGALLIAHLNQPAPDPRSIRPDLPISTAEAILKAMEKQRERRFQSAGAFAAAVG